MLSLALQCGRVLVMFFLCLGCLSAVLGEDTAFLNRPEYKQYSDAYRTAVNTRRPLLLLVGARWCGPCRQLHSDPAFYAQLRSRGIVVELDVDKHTELLRRSSWFGKSIPRLIVCRPSGSRWQMEIYDDSQNIKQFLSSPSTTPARSAR